MRNVAGVLALLLTVAAGPSNAPPLVFKSHGKVVRAISVDELTRLVPPREIAIWEPHEKKEGKFMAFPAAELFAKIYGADWKKSEEALFTCTDGFQPSIPLAEFGAHQGFLAFARVGDPEFSVLSPDTHERVPMGPLYLIWENIKDATIRGQGTVPGWPYQVSTIDLIQFADRFPNTAPPPGSTAAARRGFLQFRKRCFACHTVNGEGGVKGVELNYRANPTEYWREEWLKKWITEPASVRYNTEMHPFDKTGPDWRRDLNDVVAYLTAMAKNKIRPKDAR
ncbi:MAG: c-type cytochrome [Elusimicrobiota bacterium]